MREIKSNVGLLKNKPVIFLDLQTTGSKPDNSHILEMAWGHSQHKSVSSYLVAQPENKPIPRRIQFITGIDEKLMAAASPLEDVLHQFSLFLKSGLMDTEEKPVVIIHFAQFERPFLLAAYKQIQQSLPFKIICTHDIAKRLLPNLPTRGLKGLAGYFGVPSADFKRAADHVEATKGIWKGLLQVLEEREILTLSTLHDWLQQTQVTTRNKYEYPLPKEVRLALPKQPGVYRMVSRWGEVLYVGKATSLHDRVNSYFRGQKNRDPKKLEMLTQVYELQVTALKSPLEAALLETDEIKRLNPRYNISLKVGRRELVFFNRDFDSMSRSADQIHCFGPFSNSLVLDSIFKLREAIASDIFHDSIFFDPVPGTLVFEGLNIFCQRHSFEKQQLTSVRSILALGLHWFRQDLVSKKLEAEVLLNEELLVEDEGLTELTAEDIAEKIQRHFTRAGAAYYRAKQITRLLNASIKIQAKSLTGLNTCAGCLVQDDSHSVASTWKDFPKGSYIDIYDRMTVLNTELNKLRSLGQSVKIVTRDRPTVGL